MSIILCKAASESPALSQKYNLGKIGVRPLFWLIAWAVLLFLLLFSNFLLLPFSSFSSADLGMRETPLDRRRGRMRGEWVLAAWEEEESILNWNGRGRRWKFWERRGMKFFSLFFFSGNRVSGSFFSPSSVAAGGVNGKIPSPLKRGRREKKRKGNEELNESTALSPHSILHELMDKVGATVNFVVGVEVTENRKRMFVCTSLIWKAFNCSLK